MDCDAQRSRFSFAGTVLPKEELMKTMTKQAREVQTERADEESMEAYRELIENDGWVAYLEMMALMPSYSAGNIARILSAGPDASKVAAMRT